MDSNILRFITTTTNCCDCQRHVCITSQSAWSVAATVFCCCSVQVDNTILVHMETATAKARLGASGTLPYSCRTALHSKALCVFALNQSHIRCTATVLHVPAVNNLSSRSRSFGCYRNRIRRSHRAVACSAIRYYHVVLTGCRSGIGGTCCTGYRFIRSTYFVPSIGYTG